MPPAAEGSSPSDTVYPIRAAARLTGLSIDTLRAWERRHGAVVPSRDQRGRVYSSADLARLALLRDAVAAGHAIGRVARLDAASLAALVQRSARIAPFGRTVAAAVPPEGAPPTGPSSPAGGDGAAAWVARILDAVNRLDGATVETLLARAASLYPPVVLLSEVLAPALADVGDRWHRGERSIAEEHLLSSCLRTLLGGLVRVHTRPDAPERLLLATLPGERHEFGLLGTALLAAHAGLASVYLGTDVPVADIIATARRRHSAVVVLGVTDAVDLPRTTRALRAIRTALGSEVALWVGGPAAGALLQTGSAPVQVVPSFEALAESLRAVRAAQG